MKFFYACLFSVLAFQGSAQVFLPGNPGAFGVDGDLLTDKAHLGAFPSTGSHDWLPKGGVSPFAVFDTVGQYNAALKIMAGQNYSFTKRMTAQPYTMANGKLMLDGTYARDFFGVGISGATADKTSFVATMKVSNKNSGDPQTWSTMEGGVPNKSDIIDAYIHMRRNGNSIQVGNPSDLIVYMGASMLSTDGEHHVDFELFRDNANFAGGTFKNTGPIATGGRHAWTFNPDGTVSSYGNLAMSFSFSGAAISDMGIYIWVPYSALTTVTPAKFEFVPEDWNGNSTGSYGFVRIKMKSFSALPANAAVNNAKVEGPSWGTNSKDGGKIDLNYAYDTYEAGQYAEAAINLTALGIDPALSTSFDKCSPPFRRVLVKSRSSSSFSSALQDFVGPMPFLDAPTISPDIVTPAQLTCTVTGVTLRPAHEIQGANYTWTTADGSFIGSPNQAQAQANKPGTYTLTASLYEGCAPSSQSIVVTEYKNTPSGKATYLGVLSDANGDGVMDKVRLDVDELNAKDPSKAVYDFTWTGPKSFYKKEKSPETNEPGTYTVVVTEMTSGCSCQSTITMNGYSSEVLPVKITEEKAEVKGAKVELTWSMEAGESTTKFYIERSQDSRNFIEVGSLRANPAAASSEYLFYDHSPVKGKSYYRIRAVATSGQAAYSRVMTVDPEQGGAAKVSAFAHPTGGILVNYKAEAAEEIMAELYNSNGQLLMAQRQPVVKGSNVFTMHPSRPLGEGIYVVIVNTRTSRTGVKLMKH